jgi:uncharacterized protein YndB with AHSA1/START domain
VEVTCEIVLPEPPEEVWTALTDTERLEEWFANDVELEVEEGASGVFRWGDGEVRVALVEEVVPGERLAFRWSDGKTGESRVVFTLVGGDHGTRLTVTETQIGPTACPGWATAVGLRTVLTAVRA